MDVYECIKTRRSIRKFKDLPVEWELVTKLLDAGKSAPSSGNIQNWKFVVVTDKAAKEDLARHCGNQMWMADAPVLIAVLADIDRGKRFFGLRGERLYSIQNCAAAAQNILLLAHELGLGGCWVGALEEEKIADSLTCTEVMRPQLILAIGYPAEDPPMPPKYTLENVMYFRQFGGQGNRIRDIPQYKGFFSYKIKDAIDKTRDAVGKINKKISELDDEEKEEK